MKPVAQIVSSSLLAALLLPGLGSCSSEIRLAGVVVEGTSEQATVEYLYFRVPEGVHCPGVRIRRDGNRRFVSFLHCEQGSEMSVDSRAVAATDDPWKGNLRVEIPIDPEILERGGEMSIVLEGRGESQEFETLGYPGPKLPRVQEPAISPAAGR